MAESQTYMFSFKELAEALVKQQGIHEGIWGVYIQFGITATNIGENPKDIIPAAVVPVLKIGIQKFPEENNLTVDAAQVNPE